MMENVKCDVFISYRRVDGRDVARTVQQALLARGYKDIFFDYTSLRDGLFNEQIIEAIKLCKDFILILSPESMVRCSQKDDWVARELRLAINAGCKIIPMNVNGLFQKFPEDFPEDLSILKDIEQTKLLTDEYFDESIERLTQRMLSKKSHAIARVDSKENLLSVLLTGATLQTTSTEELSNNMSIHDHTINDTSSHLHDVGNKHVWVSPIGVSMLVYNAEKVARFYGLLLQNKLIDRLLNIENCNPMEMSFRWINEVSIRCDYVLESLYNMQELNSFVLPKTIDTRRIRKEVRDHANAYGQTYRLPIEEWENRVEKLYKKTTLLLGDSVKQISSESVGVTIAFLEGVKHEIETVLLKNMNDKLVEHQQNCERLYELYGSILDDAEQYFGRLLFMMKSKKQGYLDAIAKAYTEFIKIEFEVQRHAAAIKLYQGLLDFINGELARFSHIKENFLRIQDNNNNLLMQMRQDVGKNSPTCRDLAGDLIMNLELSANESLSVSGLVTYMPNATLSADVELETLMDALHQYTYDSSTCTSLRSQTIDDVLNVMSKYEFDNMIRDAISKSLVLFDVDPSYNNHRMAEKDYLYFCVPNVQTSRLTKDAYYRQLIDPESIYPMSTGLRDRLIIYRQKCSLPVYALRGVERMENICRQMFPTASCYIDENLRKRMEEEGFQLYPQVDAIDNSSIDSRK